MILHYVEDTIAGKYNDHVVRKFSQIKETDGDKEVVGTYFGYWTGENGKLERITEDKVYKCKKLSKEEIEEIKGRYKSFNSLA